MSARDGIRAGWVCVVVCFALVRSASAVATSDFLYGAATNGAYVLPYRYFVPTNCYAGTPQRYPLIVYLHGTGERGSDNEAQLQGGNAAVFQFLSAANQDAQPCFLVAPQCPSDIGSWSAGPTYACIKPMVDRLIAVYPIDTNRLCITGLSLGGNGAWWHSYADPRYAAIVPLCGAQWSNPSDSVLATWTRSATWVFHGSADGTVPVSNSRYMVDVIRKAGGSVIYTEYPGAGHGIWGTAYGTPGLYAWIMAQRSGQPPQGVPRLQTVSSNLLANPVHLSGIASPQAQSGATVTAIAWDTDAGSNGMATGTTTWSADVPSHTGANSVIVTASDNLNTTFNATLKFAVPASPPTDRILVDFGAAGTTTTRNWNNITDPVSGSLANMIDDGGSSTAMGMAIVRRFNSGNSLGTTTPSPALGIPATASQDNFYGNTQLFGGTTCAVAQLRVTGLDPNRLYSFSFFGSRIDASGADSRQTRYTVSGLTQGAACLEALNNSNTEATVSGIAPWEDGHVDLEVTAGPANSNPYGFYYLNAMKIFAASSATPQVPAYYVSPTGNDTNSGSLESPFATVAKARDVLRALSPSMETNLTVYLRGGWHVITNTLTFDQGDSGRNGHTIVYRAYGDEQPVISGGRRITGWTIHNAGLNIWRAPAPGLNTRQLYVNCVRATRAHRGGGLPGVARTPTGYSTTDTSMQTWGNATNIEFVYNGLQGGTLGALWVESRIGVASISGTDIAMKTPAFTWATNVSVWGTLSVTVPTDVENAYELLDEPGEWYLDLASQTLFYIPRPGEDMTSSRVVAPVLETLVKGSGTVAEPVHNIEFNGITFGHATWMRPSGNEGYVNQFADQCYGLTAPGNVTFSYARSLRFERCVFKHLGAIGLELVYGSQSNVVAGCVFSDISGSCVKLGSAYTANLGDRANTIENCYFHDTPREYHGGCGIYAGYVADTLVANNEFENMPYSAVAFSGGQESMATHNQVVSNRVTGFVQALGDGGAFYTFGRKPGFVASYNWFSGMPNRPNGAAIYPDELSGPGEVHHNLCSDIARWLYIWTSSIHDIAVRDNFTDTTNIVNAGTAIVLTGQTLITGGSWPREAWDIANGSGIEPQWREIMEVPCACSAGLTPRPAYELWRKIHFSPQQLADVSVTGDAADPDGDSMDNRGEYVAGTDPMNWLSVLTVAGSERIPLNGAAEIAWPSVAGRSYDLWRSTNLMAGFDAMVATDLPATPPLNVYTDNAAIGSNCRFYRVGIRH